MSKEAIIEKILTDAEARASAMVGEAQLKADEILSTASAQCDAYKSRAQQEKDTAAADILRRGKTVAELDAKKQLLEAKAEILGRVFERALDKVKNLDKAKYKKLILTLLSHAEDGDVVTVSKRESAIITKAVVSEDAKRRGITLTLNEKLGDFDGGMIFSSLGIDKNYTFEVEFSLLRDELEADIAKELFN